MRFCAICCDVVNPKDIIIGKSQWATCDECTHETIRQFIGLYEVTGECRTGNYMFIPKLFWTEITGTELPPFVVLPLQSNTFHSIANNYIEYLYSEDEPTDHPSPRQAHL